MLDFTCTASVLHQFENQNFSYGNLRVSKGVLRSSVAVFQGSFLLRWTRRGEELARTGSRMFRATKFFLSLVDGGPTGEATLAYWPWGVFPLTSYVHRMSVACNDNPTKDACCCRSINRTYQQFFKLPWKQIFTITMFKSSEKQRKFCLKTWTVNIILRLHLDFVLHSKRIIFLNSLVPCARRRQRRRQPARSKTLALCTFSYSVCENHSEGRTRKWL